MTSARIWRALLLLGGLLLAAGLVVLSRQRPATGYHYGSFGSHDFLEYWSAYRALRAGADPYDGLVLHPIERDAGQSPGTTLFMWNPPWTVLLIAPVLECPFPAACLAWIVCNLALLAAIGLLVCDAAGITNGRELNGPAVLSSLLFYPAMETIALGQISLVLAFAVALFLRSAVRRNEVGAGLSLILLTIKPHLFLIFGAWVLAWIVRERLWRMLAAAAFGLAALLLLTQLLWPGALLDRWESFGRAPRGPGAEGTANWMTCSLASWVRLLVSQASGRAPLWPVAAVPLAGLIATVAYLALSRPAIIWLDVIHPVLCLSVGLAPYGWPFDHAVLVLGQVLLVLRVMQPGVALVDRVAVLGALAILLGIPVALESPMFGLHLLAWYPWASLLLWVWADRRLKGGGRNRYHHTTHNNLLIPIPLVNPLPLGVTGADQRAILSGTNARGQSLVLIFGQRAPRRNLGRGRSSPAPRTSVSPGRGRA